MSEKRPRRRWRLVLLGAWVVGGWVAALVVANPLRGWLEEYRSRTRGPAYGLANDAAAAIAAKIATPERIGELLGVPATGLAVDKACSLAFTDQEQTYVHAQRPSRARPQTGWFTVTTGGRAVLGRYTARLWSGDCAETRTFYKKACTIAETVELVERRELAVGGDSGEGVTPLLPGQCIWRQVGTKPGVVGRYRVWLPADRAITVRAFTLPATVFLSFRLTFGGREAPHVNGERTVFQSLGEGEHELEVTLDPPAEGEGKPGEYTLQVHWGHGVGQACPVPRFDERECYGVAMSGGKTP